MPSTNLSKAVRTAASLLLSFLVLAYMGLIALGRWQLDEYAEFYKMRSESARSYLVERLTWSPRPISEVLYCSYGWAVNHFHHQFIIPVLSGLWLVLLAAGFLTFWLKSSRANQEESWPSLLVPLTLLGLFLAGGHDTEMFYWPAGAVAYLPTLAATLLLFLQIIEGQLDASRGRFLGGLCLTVAAGSSEAGAVFVLCYAAIRLFQRARSALGRREAPGPFLWYTLPLLMALAVLLTARLHRFRIPEPDGAAAIAGHPLASLIAGFKEMAFEIIGRTMLADTFHSNPHPAQWLRSGVRLPLAMLAGSRLVMEILLVAGVALCWSLRRPARRVAVQILEVTAAFLLASFFTIAAAHMQFGTSCCERHESLRESWMTMVLTGLAIVLLSLIHEERRQWLQRHGSWSPLLLLLAVLSLGSLRPLLRTYKVYPQLKELNEQNLESGFQAGKRTMSFTVPPEEGVITEEPIPPGVYRRPSVISGFSYDVYPDYLLGFFDKQEVVIRSLKSPEKETPTSSLPHTAH